MNMNAPSNLTARQKSLRNALSDRGGVHSVAVVRHINRAGKQVDGRDYHFNVPKNVHLRGFRYVVVPGNGGRLVVAEVVKVIPGEWYPNATEWVVATTLTGELENYFEAEKRGAAEAEARRDLARKKTELREAEAALSSRRADSKEALEKLGLSILLNSAHQLTNLKEAGRVRDSAIKQARACDDLAREIVKLELVIG